MKWLERLMDRSPRPTFNRAGAGTKQYVSPRLPREPDGVEQEALASPSPASAPPSRASVEGIADRVERAQNRQSEPAPLPTTPPRRSERADAPASLASSDRPASELASRSALEPQSQPRAASAPPTAQLEPTSADRAQATLGPASVRGKREASAIRLEPAPVRASAAPQRAFDASERASEAARQLASALEAARSSAPEAPTPNDPLAEGRATASLSAEQLRPAPAPVLERQTAGPRLSIGRLVVEVTAPAPVVVKRASPRPRAAPANKLAAPKLSTLRFGLGVK